MEGGGGVGPLFFIGEKQKMIQKTKDKKQNRSVDVTANAKKRGQFGGCEMVSSPSSLLARSKEYQGRYPGTRGGQRCQQAATQSCGSQDLHRSSRTRHSRFRCCPAARSR